MGKLLDKIRGLHKPGRPFCTAVVVAAVAVVETAAADAAAQIMAATMAAHAYHLQALM